MCENSQVRHLGAPHRVIQRSRLALIIRRSSFFKGNSERESRCTPWKSTVRRALRRAAQTTTRCSHQFNPEIWSKPSRLEAYGVPNLKLNLGTETQAAIMQLEGMRTCFCWAWRCFKPCSANCPCNFSSSVSFPFGGWPFRNLLYCSPFSVLWRYQLCKSWMATPRAARCCLRWPSGFRRWTVTGD